MHFHLALAENTSDERLRLIEQFHLGEAAVAPCHQFVVNWKSYFSCTTDQEFKAGETLPVAYIIGFEYRQFIDYARFGDPKNGILAIFLDRDIVETSQGSIQMFCTYFPSRLCRVS